LSFFAGYLADWQWIWQWIWFNDWQIGKPIDSNHFFWPWRTMTTWEFPPLRVVETPRLQVEHRRRAGNVGHSRSDRSTALNPDRRKPPKSELKWSEISFSRHINCHYYNEHLICVCLFFLLICYVDFLVSLIFNEDLMMIEWGISWDMTIGMSFSQYC
jgi:hypothetical protein